VLTSGQLPPNPSELLGSRRMADLLAELRAAFEVVLVDCAPLLPVTDPMVVSQFADGVLLIAKAGVTTKDQAQAAKAICAKAGVAMFGTVLNAASVTESDQSAYYAYYGDAGLQQVDADAGLSLLAGNRASSRQVESGRAGRHRRVRSGAG
jgi:Mrp family chromosome partitioning ATPase